MSGQILISYRRDERLDNPEDFVRVEIGTGLKRENSGYSGLGCATP
jgi:hypothetical protein